MKAWFDHILFHTRAQPQRSAIVLLDRAITYGMLGLGIDSCAQRLAHLNLSSGAPVAIAVKNPLRQMVLSLALFRIGIPSLSIENALAIGDELKFAAVLGDVEDIRRIGDQNRFIMVEDGWFAPETAGAAPPPRGFTDCKQVCRFSLTSGTTGAPKLFSDTIADVGLRVFNNFFGGIDASRNGVLCMLGLSTTFGFANACATLAAGRTLYFAESSGLAIAMIELFSIDFLLASTEQVLSLAATARRTGAQVRSLRMIVMGGSVPTRTLLEAAMNYLSKDIICQYGATEIGLIARAMARDVLTSPGLVGFIVPGVEVAIFDAVGSACVVGKAGFINVRYAADDSAPEGDKRTKPAWIALGDLGWLSSDSRLHVIGRTSGDAITDTHVSPALEVEHVFRLECDYDDSAAIVMDGGVPGSKPRIWIGVVNNRDGRADKLAAILQSRAIDVTVELFDLKFIPRGVGGKVNREQLKSALHAAQAAQAAPRRS